jgi:23S rRNA pseudouridine2605 synthase
MTEERVQKVLSRMGFGSRREIETWIEQGRVKINRNVAKLGDKVSDGDRVELNNRRAIVSLETAATRVIAYNKPEGEICSRKDEQKRASVYKNLPKISNGRWVGIGRLDINTSGLLLFTNDGELANRLMHPSSEIEREYASRVRGAVSEQQLEQLQKGVMLDDGPANFERIEDAGGEGSNHWYHVVLKEGRNREVRRLWESQQVQVSRLIRVRYGPVRLPRNLRLRKAVELTPDEVNQLATMVGYKLERPGTVKKPVRGARNRTDSDEKPLRERSTIKTQRGAHPTGRRAPSAEGERGAETRSARPAARKSTSTAAGGRGTARRSTAKTPQTSRTKTRQGTAATTGSHVKRKK